MPNLVYNDSDDGFLSIKKNYYLMSLWIYYVINQNTNLHLQKIVNKKCWMSGFLNCV